MGPVESGFSPAVHPDARGSAAKQPLHRALRRRDLRWLWPRPTKTSSRLACKGDLLRHAPLAATAAAAAAEPVQLALPGSAKLPWPRRRQQCAASLSGHFVKTITRLLVWPQLLP